MYNPCCALVNAVRAKATFCTHKGNVDPTAGKNLDIYASTIGTHNGVERNIANVKCFYKNDIRGYICKNTITATAY